MSVLKVYSASAGSGKTFRVAREYLTLALHPQTALTNYRRILAVTFTNKAAEEMKSRILLLLHELAENTNPHNADYFSNTLNLPPNILQERAKKVQRSILHDYGRFAVMTIDKFFQKILQAFVREAGLYPGFDIELDTRRLAQEAADIVLENAQQDEQRRQWLWQFVEQRIENNQSWNIKSGLVSLGMELFTEKYQRLSNDLRQRIEDKDFLTRYYANRESEIKAIDTEMRSIAVQAKGFMENNGYTIEDFPYKKSGFITYFDKIATGNYEIGVRTAAAIDNIDNWTTKSSKKDTQDAFYALNPLLKQACELWQSAQLLYNTAKLICKQFMQLGLLADMAREVRKMGRDNNILPLSDTAYIIAGLIGANDTPFLYEKIGSNYRHLIIDEFQDTSQGQWRNFLPLVASSLAAGGKSMVVGDVKQSIYRWRSGDWRILGCIDEDKTIGKYGAPQILPLTHNWRSARNVVWFNNAIIARTKNVLKEILYDGLPEKLSADIKNKCVEMLDISYADIKQTPQMLTHSGFVHLEFVGEEEDMPPREVILNRLPQLLQSMLHKGYKASDIAILVRDKKDATLVMNALLNPSSTDHTFNVMSQDTLMLASSTLVRVCIGLMRIAAGQHNPLNETFLNYHIIRSNKPHLATTEDLHSVFTSVFPEDDKEYLRLLAYCSLPEAFEKIVQRYKLHERTDELPFLQGLFDLVIQFANNKISDVSAFLQWWDERGSKDAALAGSGGQDAVMVSTIHKAKGLEYRACIVPFADWELNTKANSTVWMHCDAAPFNEISQLPLAYGKVMAESLFAEQYAQEKTQSFLDNLNLLYVALTRAKETLYVYVPVGKTLGASRISDALQMAAANPDAFAPAQPTRADESVLEFGSMEENVDAGKAVIAAPADSGDTIHWNAYFTRGPVPAIRSSNGQ
jgi:ATP-dependent exoDNAse (exonuclease V) beta subunit